MTKISAQNYPRIQQQSNPLYGCLDDAMLVQHIKKISPEKMSQFIVSAIENAERKSGREILKIPDHATDIEVQEILIKEGKELFKYFKKYCGDPAASAYQLYQQNYRDVGIEQFKLRSLQKERMNSGWRYQFLAFDCARSSERFRSVSEIGAAEADFNAVIDFNNQMLDPLNLYVSVKNRTNTMGGQDWPKAIQALEAVANTDKNRHGPYLCVFGVAMEKGKNQRLIKTNSRNNNPYSLNTEIWYANYFWPFFANYSYEEIMQLVLDVLLKRKDRSESPSKVEIPEQLLESFRESCYRAELINDDGIFYDPHKLVEFFCKR
jgi:hypothetical protein